MRRLLPVQVDLVTVLPSPACTAEISQAIERDGAEPRTDRSNGVVGMARAMDGEQRLLHQIVEQRWRTEAAAQQEAELLARQQQELRIRTPVPGLGPLK